MAAIEDQRTLPEREQTNTDLLGVLKSLFRWKKVILTACGLAAIGSVIIVLLLPVYYQANTVFYAVSPDQSMPELLFGDGGIAPELYGNENDIDRLLTISESNELIDFLVDSFQLYEHYDIDPDSPKGLHYVRRHFMGLYEVTKTKRDAIQLSIEDEDPELAATIANTAREKINNISQSLVQNGQRKAIATFMENITSKEQQLSVLSDTLQSLRNRYGIFNTEAQSEGLTSLASSTETRLVSQEAKLKAYREGSGRGFRDSVAVYEIRVRGLEEEMAQIDIKLSDFNEGLSRVLVNTRQYQSANNTLSQDKEKLKQYQAVFQSDIPAVLLVEKAMIPNIKSRPFRTLIVLASILITFIFTLIGVLLFEAYSHINWREVYEGK